MPHGEIRIAFTPDEEVGNGVKYFDYARFGAKAAYTVDGGEVGEIGYETFNAASCRLTIRGVSTHPGSSKGKMKTPCCLGWSSSRCCRSLKTRRTPKSGRAFTTCAA